MNVLLSENSIVTLVCWAFVFGFLSCNRPSAPDCFKRAGENAIRSIQLESGVELLRIDDLIITNVYVSDSNRVEVLGPKNLLEEVRVERFGAALNIDYTSTCDWVRDMGIRMVVNVYLSELSAIEYNATEALTVHDQLEVDYFDFKSDFGTGDVLLKVQADSMNVYVNEGLTNTTLQGTARIAGLFNQGYGKMNAFDMEIDVALCNNSGINSMSVHALDYLYAEINNSGDIIFKGNPEVDQNISPTATGQLLPFE